jgi:hypothetical protein
LRLRNKNPQLFVSYIVEQSFSEMNTTQALGVMGAMNTRRKSRNRLDVTVLILILSIDD